MIRFIGERNLRNDPKLYLLILFARKNTVLLKTDESTVEYSRDISVSQKRFKLAAFLKTPGRNYPTSSGITPNLEKEDGEFFKNLFVAARVKPPKIETSQAQSVSAFVSCFMGRINETGVNEWRRPSGKSFALPEKIVGSDK